MIDVSDIQNRILMNKARIRKEWEKIIECRKLLDQTNRDLEERQAVVADSPKKVHQIDFSKAWKGSNVILRTDNAEGRLLHASKADLARESTVFHGVFFSGHNTEAKKKQEYEIRVDYNVMHKILILLYGANEDHVFVGKNAYYVLDCLVLMHVVVNFLKLHRIRKLCVERLRRMAVKMEVDEESGAAMAAAVRLGLYDICVERLKLDPSSLTSFFKKPLPSSFFSKCTDTGIWNIAMKPCLSKAEVPWLHDRLFPDTPFRHYRPPRKVVRLEDVAQIPEDVQCRLTKKWNGSDVRLRTWNCNGRLLYAKKKTLAKASPYFDNLFFGNRARKQKVYSIDVEFVTMTLLLWTVHRLPPQQIFADPVPVYDYFFSSGPDQLDLNECHNLARNVFMGQRPMYSLDGLDVANKMGFSEIRVFLMEMLSGGSEQDYDAWISGRQLVYLRNGKEVDLTTSNTKKSLSLQAFFKTYPIKRN